MNVSDSTSNSLSFNDNAGDSGVSIVANLTVNSNTMEFDETDVDDAFDKSNRSATEIDVTNRANAESIAFANSTFSIKEMRSIIGINSSDDNTVRNDTTPTSTDTLSLPSGPNVSSIDVNTVPVQTDANAAGAPSASISTTGPKGPVTFAKIVRNRGDNMPNWYTDVENANSNASLNSTAGERSTPNDMAAKPAVGKSSAGPSTNSRNAKTSKPTPIQLGFPDGYADIVAGLDRNFPNAIYRWQQFKANSLPRIFTDDIDTKDTIQKWLLASGVVFNTYAERGQKRKSFLRRGLLIHDDDYNIGCINTTLRDAMIVGNFEISRFATGYMKRNPNDNATPIYRVVFEHDVVDASVVAIRTIGRYSVRFEKMKPSAVIQCRRCQRFAHTASNCAHNYRCVQCVTEHGPGCCPRNTNKKIILRCVNCKANGFAYDGHTANDVDNCPYYTKLTAIKNAANTPKPTRRGNMAKNVIVPNNIFEAVAANDPTPRNSTVQTNVKRTNLGSKSKSGVATGSKSADTDATTSSSGTTSRGASVCIDAKTANAGN